MSSLNSVKYAALAAQTGLTEGSLSQQEYTWLANQTGLSGITLNEQWIALLNGMGYVGTITEMQIQSWQNIGYVGTWNELAYQFWTDSSGAYGPNVRITASDPQPFCDYAPAGTCAAAADYTAVDTGFTNDADTWLWTLEPPVAGVVLTNATLKTCTVTSTTDADISFNLKVVATDSVSTDSADRTTAYTHYHRETLTVSVAENTNPGCDYDGGGGGQTGCTSGASYTASIVGTPTSIVWSLSGIGGGTASIASGQGTGSCVVETTGGTPEVSYTLLCTVTSQFQNTVDGGNYAQTKTDDPSVLFLGPDINTVELVTGAAMSPFDVSTRFLYEDTGQYLSLIHI